MTKGEDTIMDRIESRQLIRYGHVMKMKNNKGGMGHEKYVPSNRTDGRKADQEHYKEKK